MKSVEDSSIQQDLGLTAGFRRTGTYMARNMLPNSMDCCRWLTAQESVCHAGRDAPMP
jgi:hypothetical protein